jgi:hypothetical protein
MGGSASRQTIRQLRELHLGAGTEGQRLRQLQHLDKDPAGALGIHGRFPLLWPQLEPSRGDDSEQGLGARLSMTSQIGIED